MSNTWQLFAITLLLAAPMPISGFADDTPQAVPKTDVPTPYDDKLVRLSEILGSVQYLRTLCLDPEPEWRSLMQKLLQTESTNEPERTKRLTAAYNHGYRAFAGTYTRCTPQARTAEESYRAEGATLATEIVARYGN